MSGIEYGRAFQRTPGPSWPKESLRKNMAISAGPCIHRAHAKSTLKENFQRQLWYYLTHYPDAYTIIAIFCITFMLVLVAGWILGKTLKGGQAKSEV